MATAGQIEEANYPVLLPPHHPKFGYIMEDDPEKQLDEQRLHRGQGCVVKMGWVLFGRGVAGVG